VDHQTDPSANGSGSKTTEPRPPGTSNGASAPAGRDISRLIIESVGAETAREDNDPTKRTTIEEDPSIGLVAPMLRAGSSALIAFQLGYLLLDRLEYPQTFARTSPIHAAGVVLGLIAFATALSPLAMRRWRETTLVIDTAIIACTAWIAVINSDSEVHLVLMDIQMPIVDGYEATVTIRNFERENNRHRTPIVALTASALEEAVHRTKAAGCDAHVTKPVKKSTLLDAIRDAVEGDRPDDQPKDAGIHEEETWRTEL
jgi:CheY-like chemotaxis protein